MSDKYNLDDLIRFSIEQKPIEFDHAFQDVLHDKLVGAIQAKKLEIAKGIVTDHKDDEEIDIEDSEWIEEE